MSSSTKKYSALLVLLLLVFAWIAFPRGYGEISEDGYALTTALYSVCNQREPERLQRIAEMVDAAHDSGRIVAKEHAWLHAIISLGEQGDWESAASASRKILQAQTEEI